MTAEQVLLVFLVLLIIAYFFGKDEPRRKDDRLSDVDQFRKEEFERTKEDRSFFD